MAHIVLGPSYINRNENAQREGTLISLYWSFNLFFNSVCNFKLQKQKQRLYQIPM